MPNLSIGPKLIVESAFNSSEQRITLLAKTSNDSSIVGVSSSFCRLFWHSVGEILTEVWHWITGWCKKTEDQPAEIEWDESEELPIENRCDNEISPPPEGRGPEGPSSKSSWDDEIIAPSDSDRDNPL